LKKPSAAKRPENIVFFIDRSLGRIDVPTVLRDAGFACECHDDHWDQSTPDAVWLAGVAGKQWVVLTKDERIRYRPLEVQALVSAKLRAFIVICGNLRGTETAAILLRAMPRIQDVLSRQKGPFIYYVYKNATVRRAT
jgi:hypothetical protein